MVICIWLFFACLLSVPCSAAEYLYPVAWVQRADGIKIYLNYQKSVAGMSELLLWEWDPVTKVVGPVVLPAYTPAAVRLLPGTTDRSGGLCFVDKGRILIKSFNKRSPKSISFYEPIDDIAVLEWIDQESFYFMGKEGRNFGIFHGTTHGGLSSVVYREGTDYLYPQAQAGQLFFIARTGDQFAIMQVSAPQLQRNETFEELLSHQHQLVIKYPLIPATSPVSIVELGAQPAAFLHMTSDREGYYVEHPARIDRYQQHIPCKLHQIISDESGEWQDQVLFDFKIPAHLLVGASTERLYESLLPLLPRIEHDAIYFVTCQEQSLRSDVYKYQMTTQQITPVSAQSLSESNFAPLRVYPMVFYGGMLSSEDLGTGNRLPAIWINELGMLCAELPAIVDVPAFEGQLT